MSVLGGGVDELDVQGLEVRAAGRGDHALAQGDSSLLNATNAALDHEPVLVDFSVVESHPQA